jgi:hypothetical protein
MNMQKPETTEDDVLSEMFHVGYAEAKRLVLEYNDLDAARDCLGMVKPESKSSLWRWTDLMAALLFRKGEYSECGRVLASYDTRYPGDPRVVSLIQMLRKKSLEIGMQNGLTWGAEIGFRMTVDARDERRRSHD